MIGPRVPDSPRARYWLDRWEAFAAGLGATSMHARSVAEAAIAKHARCPVTEEHTREIEREIAQTVRG